ncbi:MAG TPA: bifunctional phosphopantothenoylcysteine decarboxylase/phosphopantothenate--cysteine ligase CoaBC [Mycobacteriales bacterium]|nr:bifunctional phosphopantothenoylcysteine decarboxylase/phosphopantothenate--cysteine ligase CoaBC [Mycobacteriales bacterium]
MSTVVLGVGGGIAAYKACELLRRLREAGHEITVVPTASALHFVGAATWEALSGRPVSDAVWDDVPRVPHVRLGQEADLVVVAPCTADLLAKAAHGLADDLLTNTLLTARCPVVLAPAMHTEMWEHTATTANVATLRERGVCVVEPASGRLTGADTGPGRLPEPDELAAICTLVLDAGLPPRDLAGRRVVVSAGGTREPLDPVRWLGNRSSGLQGYAVARAARLRGAHVTLVAANTALPDPASVDVVRVETAEQLRAAVCDASSGADVVVMAAAVADFRPVSASPSKIKKQADGGVPTVELERTVDVLAALGASAAPGRVLVGFAAETDDVLAHGRAKLAAKGADLMVVNHVGSEHETGTGFGTGDNAATIIGTDGFEQVVPRVSKERLAHALLDAVTTRLP